MITVTFLDGRTLQCRFVKVDEHGEILVVDKRGPTNIFVAFDKSQYPIFGGEPIKSTKYYVFATSSGKIISIHCIPKNSNKLALPPVPTCYCIIMNEKTFEEFSLSINDQFSLSGG